MLVNWITTELFINTTGLVAIPLLSVLLLVKEFVRTANRPQARIWMRRLDIAILPLLVVFVLVVIGRLISL